MKKSLFLLMTLFILSFSAGQVASQDHLRDTNAIWLEDYPAVEYWIGLWNGQSDPDVYRDYLGGFYQNLDAVTGGSAGGPRLVYRDVPELRDRYDDFSLRVYEVIEDEDIVIVRYRVAIVEDEERYSYQGIVLFRLENIKIKQSWHLYHSCLLETMPCDSTTPINI